MTDWPDGVPFFNLRSGYGAQPGESVLSTPMDVGPAKRRRRTTSSPSTVTGSAYMTREQAQRFEEFWRDTLKDGTLSFYKSDGLYQRRNVLSQSEDLSSGWVIPAQLTRSNAISVIDGAVASRFLKTSGGSVSIQQPVGELVDSQAFTGFFETHGVAWVDGPTTAVSIWDATAGSHVALCQISWSPSNNPTASIISGDGSASVTGLGIGPNGGFMAKVTFSADGANLGNARSVFIYPTGITTNVDAVTVHWAQLEDAASFSEYEPVGSEYRAKDLTRGGAKSYRIVGVPSFAPMGVGHRVSVTLEVLP